MAERAVGIELGHARARGATANDVGAAVVVDVAAAVGLDRAGTVLVGDAAAAEGSAVTGFVSSLGRAEPYLLRGTPYGAEALVAQLLRHVADSAGAGDAVATALVHDDGWGEYQLDLLREAVRLAAVGPVLLVPAATARAYDAGDLAVGGARWAWAQREGGTAVPVPGSPLSARTVLLGAGAGAALAIGGGAAVAGAAGGAGSGATLGSFAAEGGGATLGSFAADQTGGSTLGDFAGQTGGSTLGDFAGQTGGSTLGDFAGQTGGSTLGDFAAPPAKAKRGFPKVPAAIAAAVVAVGVVAGVALASTSSDDDDTTEQAAATTTTEAEEDPEVTSTTAGATTTTPGDSERLRTPFLFACGGEGNLGDGDGGPALRASCGGPRDLVVQPDGTVYFLDNHARASDGAARVRVVDPDGTIRSIEFGAVDGKELDDPSSIAVAADGTIYVADRDNNRILRRTPSGAVTRFAGAPDGTSADSSNIADGVPAATAPVGRLTDLALAPDGSLWFGDNHNGMVQRIDRSTGTLTVEIGRGDRGSTTAGPVPVREANLVTLLPGSDVILAFSPSGVLHVGDEKRLYRVENGALVHIAGNGEFVDKRETNGDDGPATEAALGTADLAFAPDGTLYLSAADGVGEVRTIDAAGIIRHFLGDETPAPADEPTATRWAPSSLAFMPDGWLLVAEEGTSYEMLRRVPPKGLTRSGEPRT